MSLLENKSCLIFLKKIKNFSLIFLTRLAKNLVMKIFNKSKNNSKNENFKHLLYMASLQIGNLDKCLI
jgi:hypothetical protein